jgi:hypothetical protein
MQAEYPLHRSCDGAGRDLAHLRDRASHFFQSLSVAELAREQHRHLWISDWLRVADDYRTLAESARETRSAQIAGEAWLCSLTALEVVRSLCNPGDVESAALADEVGTGLRGLETEAGLPIERVKIDCFDQGALAGFFLPALRYGSAAPAVICVGDDDATLGSMISRLLPVALCGTMSLLLVDPANSTVHRSFKPEHRLQFWLDYLEARPDVDPRRIGIYGEGVGAAHASRLALSDRRIAAAVCDGGLVRPVMCQASLRWMTGQAVPDGISREAVLPPRRVPCPLLMVVGSRSMVWEQDALELQADYRRIGADCSVVVPNNVPHPFGEVENFVAVDDFIVEWLASKLGAARKLDAVTRL